VNEYEELDLVEALDMNETKVVVDSKGRTYQIGTLMQTMVTGANGEMAALSFLPLTVHKRHQRQIKSALRRDDTAGIPNNLIRDSDQHDEND
jgi:hypothetical protein